MSPLRLGIVLFSLTTVLSACGGGGGGSGMLAQPSPSPITYDTMVSEVSEILQSSDSLSMTDVFLAHPSIPQEVRIQTACGLGQCEAYFSDYKLVDISLSDFAFSDPTNDHRFFTGSGGVQMADIRGRDEEAGVTTDFKNLGGWLDYSAFAIEVYSIVSGVSSGVDLRGTVFGGAYSLGDATGTTPTFGNATWTGTMVGGDTSLTANRGNRIQGDATLYFDLSQLDIDVAFTNIRDIDVAFSNDNDDRARLSHENIVWENIPVTSGSFATGSDESSIEGRFYGPNHEEVGGIFEHNEIVGAFGAKR